MTGLVLAFEMSGVMKRTQFLPSWSLSSKVIWILNTSPVCSSEPTQSKKMGVLPNSKQSILLILIHFILSTNLLQFTFTGFSGSLIQLSERKDCLTLVGYQYCDKRVSRLDFCCQGLGPHPRTKTTRKKKERRECIHHVGWMAQNREGILGQAYGDATPLQFRHCYH